MPRSLDGFTIVAPPVPLDLNILKALTRPPRGFHLYLSSPLAPVAVALSEGIEPLSEPPRGLRVLVGAGEHPRFVVDITTKTFNYLRL